MGLVPAIGNTGKSPVTSSTGASETDHSGLRPVLIHWSQTCECAHPEPLSDQASVTCNYLGGTRPALFQRYFFAPSLLLTISETKIGFFCIGTKERGNEKPYGLIQIDYWDRGTSPRHVWTWRGRVTPFLDV